MRRIKASMAPPSSICPSGVYTPDSFDAHRYAVDHRRYVDGLLQGRHSDRDIVLPSRVFSGCHRDNIWPPQPVCFVCLPNALYLGLNALLLDHSAETRAAMWAYGRGQNSTCAAVRAFDGLHTSSPRSIQPVDAWAGEARRRLDALGWLQP
jgi:hypothetical protein